MIQWYYYHKVILILLQTAPAPQGKLMKRYLIHSQAISVPLQRIEKRKKKQFSNKLSIITN